MRFKCLEADGETGVFDVVQSTLHEEVKIHGAYTSAKFEFLNVSLDLEF